MINKKLKAFVRFDGSGRVVPGSLILRQNKPKVGRWQQIVANECCEPAIKPTQGVVVVGAVSATTIDITWPSAVVASGSPAIIHYVVYLDGVEVAIIAAAATKEYTYTGLTTATSYDLAVGAFDGKNEVISTVVTQITS